MKPRPVGRRRANRHAICAHGQRARESRAHLVAPGGDARFLADQHAVRVDELEAGRLHSRVGIRQQSERVGATVGVVVGREERADVPEPGGSQQGVGERMRDHVTVGVADEPARMVEGDAAEHKRHSLPEGVCIDSDPDAVIRHSHLHGA